MKRRMATRGARRVYLVKRRMAIRDALRVYPPGTLYRHAAVLKYTFTNDAILTGNQLLKSGKNVERSFSTSVLRSCLMRP